jgi:hypothetical protein
MSPVIALSRKAQVTYTVDTQVYPLMEGETSLSIGERC